MEELLKHLQAILLPVAYLWYEYPSNLKRTDLSKLRDLCKLDFLLPARWSTVVVVGELLLASLEEKSSSPAPRRLNSWSYNDVSGFCHFTL